MKLLIISDVHGNYEALLAVAHAEEADEVHTHPIGLSVEAQKKVVGMVL
jgi:hypothetical protein